MQDIIKILIIVTSHFSLGDGREHTGVWLEELTTPYYAFLDAGAEVTVVSVAGGQVPIDPRSVRPAGQNDPSVERYLADAGFRATVKATLRFTADQADGFDAVFLPGGHGTMWDYPESPEIARVVVRFLEAGKVVAAVCHGPAGLVSARFDDGRSVVSGRRVAGFKNSEERAAGLDDDVPFLLESRLRDLGADYVSGADFQAFAVRDANLVTGQNPASATETARLTLAAIRDVRATPVGD